ncbi:MAG: hypothetical protein KJP23_30735 [Deltaproteobacteria bacterium]|nr:hypothetical protein [Deltaproteobacteria bacterium]
MTDDRGRNTEERSRPATSSVESKWEKIEGERLGRWECEKEKAQGVWLKAHGKGKELKAEDGRWMADDR